MLLGEKIKVIRKQKGIGRNELAKLIDVSGTHITHIEKKQRENMNLLSLCKIAKVFDISVDDLIKETEFDLSKEEEE